MPWLQYRRCYILVTKGGTTNIPLSTLCHTKSSNSVFVTKWATWQHKKGKGSALVCLYSVLVCVCPTNYKFVRKLILIWHIISPAFCLTGCLHCCAGLAGLLDQAAEKSHNVTM